MANYWSRQLTGLERQRRFVDSVERIATFLIGMFIGFIVTLVVFCP